MKRLVEEIDILISAWRSIVTEITPNMRAIYIDWDEETIHHYFFFDGEFTEEEEEDARCIETEVTAQISYLFMCELHCIRLDYPAPVVCPGICIYKRKESNSSHHEFHTLVERKIDTSDRKWSIVLSGLEALIGSVTPNLRVVEVTWDETSIALSFIYDGPFTKDDEEESKKVAEKMAKDFPKSTVSATCLRIDYPNEFPEHQEKNYTWLYARKEARQ